MSFPALTTLDSAFLREQEQRFQSLRQDALHQSVLPLGASYHPSGWGLDDVLGFRGRSADRWLLDHGTTGIAEEFKSVAGICAVALGAPDTDNAWVEWLECLRREAVALKPSEVRMHSRRTEPRPEPDFEVVAVGLLTKPTEIRPDPDAEIISLHILEIDDVCGESERVCRRLADEALKGELTRGTRATFREVSSPGPIAGAPQSSAATPPDRSKTMTVREAAEVLRVSDDTLHRMRKRKEIEMFKVGALWRVRASEVMRVRQHSRLQNR